MGKHHRTLVDIFAEPVKANIRWRDIASLLAHLGAELSVGKGSHVRAVLRGVRATFHRPHPSPDTDHGAVRSIRRFLLEAGFNETSLDETDA